MDLQTFLFAFAVPILATTLTMTVPLFIPALGEIFAERSGVLSIGIEGYMILGALTAYMGAIYTGNILLGLLFGIIGGVAGSLIHAFLSVKLGYDQIVSGIGINIFSFGLTSFLYRTVIVGGFGYAPSASSFETLKNPLLTNLPIIGPILFHQNFFVFLMFPLLFACAFLLFRTFFGLSVRATGENPLAADSMGINVQRTRLLSIIIGGIMAGIGGASLTLGYLSTFAEGITAGRGFIVIAIVILGGWNPYRVLGGSLLFSGIFAIQIRLQAEGIGIPYPFLMMTPYIIAIIVLVGAVGRVAMPKALAIPYVRKR